MSTAESHLDVLMDYDDLKMILDGCICSASNFSTTTHSIFPARKCNILQIAAKIHRDDGCLQGFDDQS
jgi:hypothetical protein